MKRIAEFIANKHLLVLIVMLILIIPAIIGYLNTKINYDILVYLPEDNETVKGQKILKDEFGIGGYAFIMIENDSNKTTLELEEKIKKIDGVNICGSLVDLMGTTITKDMLPDEVIDNLYNDNETIIFVGFSSGTSEDKTVKGLEELRKLVEADKIASMTALVLDTKILTGEEMTTYIVISIILILIALIICTDSYLIPFFLLGNIGIAIVYNMGTNIFLGTISYITFSIVAILQLGVTTDYSIFLYHEYENEKIKNKNKTNIENMTEAIIKTFKSIVGSSLTTFAGFLSLCTMSLTLGMDIGIVMAKGVLFGLICVLTLFPCLLLTFDKYIEKTKHKRLLPSFENTSNFIIKHKKAILIVFLILLIPAIYGYKNYKTYYKLDQSVPETLAFRVANKDLKEKYNIVSPSVIILDKDIKSNDVDDLVDEIEQIEGISWVVSSNSLENDVFNLLDEDVLKYLDNDKYQLVILNSMYEGATDELNSQIIELNKIVDKYDEDGIVCGEGALLSDLGIIADRDFKYVTYTSIIIIFIIMILVLHSISLPILLVCTIEFAIFVNLSISCYMDVTLPFIASIVVGTIQLGSTIDYAILLSTKYITNRKLINNKESAMNKTLKETIPAIFTSGICFFCATIGVSLYTKVDMIGSICTLLCRGAIISMLVVIFILPVLLMLFDKFVIKKEVR